MLIRSRTKYNIFGSKRLPVGRSDQVLKFMLKNQGVIILSNSASY